MWQSLINSQNKTKQNRSPESEWSWLATQSPYVFMPFSDASKILGGEPGTGRMPLSNQVA